MASNVTATFGLTYTPPSAPVNSGVASFQAQATYNSSNVGQVDIQTSDVPGTLFVIPFGSVNQAKVVAIKNMMSSDIGIRLNGSGSDNFRLSSGGCFVEGLNTAPSANPITAITIVTTATPLQIENALFWIFGD